MTEIDLSTVDPGRQAWADWALRTRGPSREWEAQQEAETTTEVNDVRDDTSD